MATTKMTKVLPVRQPLKRQPTHPGEILREDVLPALRMRVSQAARELGVSRQLLHRILAGRAPVTPDMRLFDRYFCRSMDAYFESCNQLFRNVGEEDRERLQQVQLANFSVLPVGVQYVPANERYTVNHNVMNSAFGMLRQLIQENSASFTQDQDSGTAKEMTATEAMARVASHGSRLFHASDAVFLQESLLHRDLPPLLPSKQPLADGG